MALRTTIDLILQAESHRLWPVLSAEERKSLTSKLAVCLSYPERQEVMRQWYATHDGFEREEARKHRARTCLQKVQHFISTQFDSGHDYWPR